MGPSPNVEQHEFRLCSGCWKPDPFLENNFSSLALTFCQHAREKKDLFFHLFQLHSSLLLLKESNHFLEAQTA
ncbi:hypothetical protein EI42_03098 [Thermosporothrix hazakensis]|uniref:Uncharacterized protein n=1 Tax=Thermosporothrix hazakensis TaxID=644383 RepID=A0A326U5X4_THEHA|nr:hypothetical protein EI42_03098 [Thermosporothrix hazakensis]